MAILCDFVIWSYAGGVIHLSGECELTMAMKLDEFAHKYPDRPAPVPAEYAGQWIAWDVNRREIVANGSDMSKVRRAAITAGHPEPILQKVPRGPFVGGV